MDPTKPNNSTPPAGNRLPAGNNPGSGNKEPLKPINDLAGKTALNIPEAAPPPKPESPSVAPEKTKPPIPPDKTREEISAKKDAKNQKGKGPLATFRGKANAAGDKLDTAKAIKERPVGYAADKVKDKLKEQTTDKVHSVANKQIDKAIHKGLNNTLGRVPVAGNLLRLKGNGDVLAGLSSLAVGNPFTRLLLNLLPIPKTGPLRAAANCSCGLGQCACQSTCCGQCACASACSGIGAPAAILLIVILLIGTAFVNQPNFVNNQFCEQFSGTAYCGAGGTVTMQGTINTLNPGDILVYQELEAQYHVPWFYLAAWEEVATQYGKKPLLPTGNFVVPGRAIDAAHQGLETEIAQLYPDLVPAAPPGPIIGNGEGDQPTSSPVTQTCGYDNFSNAYKLALTENYFTASGTNADGQTVVITYQNDGSGAEIKIYNQDGTLGSEYLYYGTSVWSRTKESDNWATVATAIWSPLAADADFPGINNATAYADQKYTESSPSDGLCLYAKDGQPVLMTDPNGRAAFVIQNVFGVTAGLTYDYTKSAPLPSNPSITPTPMGPPSPSPSSNPALASEQAAAASLRTSLTNQIQLLESNARGGSFGLFLINQAEYTKYGEPSGAQDLNPWDATQAGSIIAQDLVDTYNNSLINRGSLTYAGVPYGEILDSTMKSWLTASVQGVYKTDPNATLLAYLAKLVPQSENELTVGAGWANGIYATWPADKNNPHQGQAITTAERYYLCLKVEPLLHSSNKNYNPASDKICQYLATNQNTITLRPPDKYDTTTNAPSPFVQELSMYYDPSLSVGAQLKDGGSLQVLMGALLSEPNLWGNDKQAMIQTQVIGADGSQTGQTAITNAYVQSISSYALSLFKSWEAEQKVDLNNSGINGFSSLDQLELGFWREAMNATSKTNNLPWQYLAATYHEDKLFTCASVYPNNIITGTLATGYTADPTSAVGKAYKGIGLYDGKWLNIDNPTAISGCWRAGSGYATSWDHIGNSSVTSSVETPQAAMNYCTTLFQRGNDTKDNCGSVTVQMINAAGSLQTETMPVTSFCDCFTGVLATINAIETTNQTEKIVALNDAALRKFGYDPTTYRSNLTAGKANLVIVYPKPPTTNPAGWSWGMQNLITNGVDAQGILTAGSVPAADPVRQQVVDAISKKLVTAITQWNSGAFAAPTAAPGASTVPTGTGQPNMWDFWHGWATYQKCALNSSGAAPVNVPDPLHPSKPLAAAAPCGWIQDATDLVVAYYGITIGNYQLTFVNEYDGLHHPAKAWNTSSTAWSTWTAMSNWREWDCGWASLLMLLEKETKGQLNVTSGAQARDVIYTLRDASGDFNPYLSTAANASHMGYRPPYPPYKYAIAIMPKDMVNGVRKVFGAGLKSRANWTTILTLLKNGHGVALSGDYAAWGPSNPANGGRNMGWVAGRDGNYFARASVAGHTIYLEGFDSSSGTDMIKMFDPLFYSGNRTSDDGRNGTKGLWVPADQLKEFAFYNNFADGSSQAYVFYFTNPASIQVPAQWQTRPSIGGGSATVPVVNPQPAAPTVSPATNPQPSAVTLTPVVNTYNLVAMDNLSIAQGSPIPLLGPSRLATSDSGLNLIYDTG